MYIYFEGKDGSVAIMVTATDEDLDKTIEQFRQSHPDGFYPRFHQSSKPLAAPSDRKFRDAWTFKKGKIIVDEKKAEKIHLDRIRQERNQRLQALDVESLRNLTNPVKLEEIEEEKQALRDIPQNFKFDLKNPGWPF